MNRLKSRSYANDPENTAPVFYKYDNQSLPSGAPTLTLGKSIGRLLAVTYGDLSSAGNYYGEYDELGRVKKSCQQTVNQSQAFSYQMSYDYDLSGAMTKEVYPSGREVRRQYTGDGKLAGVVKDAVAQTYYAGGAATDATNRLQYSAHGSVSGMKLGNGRWEHTNFNNRLQPTEIGLGSSGTDSSLLKLEYEYASTGQTDNNGNVLKQKISIGSTVFTQTYTYDQVNRLASATETSSLLGGGQSWSESFGYDRFGNLWVSSSSGMTLSTLTPQSQSAFTQARNQLVASSYDKAGNQKVDGQSRTFDYDAENRQVRFNNGAASYVYDGDGKRVKKVDASGTTIFVYNVGGQLIAEYTTAAPQAQGGGGVSYLTQDHLGSTRVVTDKNGVVKSRRDYLPFGQEINANLGTNIGGRNSVGGYNVNDGQRKRFTGHERDDESGLDFMKTRYYSSSIGKFSSIDPVCGTEEDPQSWNGYTYCRNNPLVFTDPDGMFPIYISPITLQKIKNYLSHGFYETNWEWERRVNAARAFLKWQERFRNGLYVRNNYAVQVGPNQYEPGEWVRLDIENLDDDNAVAWANVVNEAINRGNMIYIPDEVKANLNAAAGLIPKPSQIHHFATNKSKTFTPQMEKIAKRYGLDLDGNWNKESLPHQGRHATAYHEFVLRGMQRAAREAGRNANKFMELFEKYVKEPVRKNPSIMYK